MKKRFTALFVSLILCVSSAFSVEPEDIFLSYGGNIEAENMFVNASLGLTNNMFNAINTGGWGVPEILGEFEYAYPIFGAPLTFGGYLGLNLRGYPDGYYDGTWYNQGMGGKTDTVFHFVMRMGGIASYHVNLQIENFDINVLLKMGLSLDISKAYPSGIYNQFDWELALRGTYFILDNIGITFSLGYPAFRAGAVFQL